ncbi:MAG: class I SAM-dependent methyltransferase, partial [Oxalicibacterium faecigallinarum]|uniref:class I SAM-dependent methyltransferase n=1 Tax=Oxalicibacterium faecigallinarum TaxID=573741 RepID=UPI00280A308E
MYTDIPSPIDLRNMEDAREWATSAMSKRPWRTAFFNEFERIIQERSAGQACRVLELGSGPGFLAEHLLLALNNIQYVALDFSAAMHTLAAERLGDKKEQVTWMTRSFRESDWNNELRDFDFVITHQAIHELRHKQHAPTLHQQVREVLNANGTYLVCDHFCGEGGMANDQLYMTVQEQVDALKQAAYPYVTQIKKQGGLVLHQACMNDS